MELTRTDDFLGQGGKVTLALEPERSSRMTAEFIPTVIDILGIGGFDVAFYRDGQPHGYTRKGFFPWTAIKAIESHEVTA